MFSTSLSHRTILLLSFVVIQVVAQAPQNPLTDFCRRFGHQTAVVGSKLYIDGGYVNANPIAQNPQAVINTGLLYNDLEVLNGPMPQLYANLSKNSTIPDVAGGILWADEVNQAFYLFGGEFSNVPQAFALWVYDVVLNQWNESTTSTDVNRVSYGAGVAVNELGLGYYYGGYINNHTTPAYDGPSMATSSLIIYDMSANDFTNNTGPDGVGRAEGVMVYLPISRQGALIYFGGVEFDENGTEIAVPMSTIFVYEIAEGKWYTQNATGDIPGSRRKFCAGATWAQDQSSYNVYLYGGAGFGDNATGFDDVYILTMPGFVWVKWWPTEPGPGNPHNTLTCNVINNSQMLIIGGLFPNSSQCDAPDVQGTHNLNLGKANDSNAMWAPFQYNITGYQVPTEILSIVGGQPNGAATLNQPMVGWNNRDLQVYFTQRATATVRSPTRLIPTATSSPKAHHSTSTGTIVGASVGGAIGLLLVLILVIIFCLRHRRQRLHKQPSVKETKQKPTELPELPERSSTYHTKDERGRYSPLPQRLGSKSITNTTQSTEPGSPKLSQGLSAATPTSPYPAPPPLAPAPLMTSPSYETSHDQIHAHQHPAHAPPRPEYPPPPQALDHSQNPPPSQYPSPLYPQNVSMTNTPAHLYGPPGSRSYAAHEAVRSRKLPNQSPDLNYSPHSQKSSQSGSSNSQNHGVTDVRSPQPRLGLQVPAHGSSGSGLPIPMTGHAWSYEMPTIRSPDRPREMGVSSRAEFQSNTASPETSHRDASNNHDETRVGTVEGEQGG